MRMSDSSPLYLGLEIGGTKLQIVAGDALGRIVRRWRAVADRARGGPGICDQLRDGLAELRNGISPRAVGVGFGGPNHFRTGRIARSHQIDGWDGFELKTWMREQTRLPVATENDANTAALAEAVIGAGAGADPVFYFNLGSGVGGGIVIGSSIFHGLPPGEAEFGHLRLDRAGATVESRCSGWAVDRCIRAAAEAEPVGFLAQSLDRTTTGGEARHLAPALARGDALARRIIDEWADDVGLALSHVVHLIHPAVIVMGGGLSLTGEPLRLAVAEALPRHVMEAFHPVPPVRLAQLGENAVPAGALILAGSS